jgi:thymidine phosphorylase
MSSEKEHSPQHEELLKQQALEQLEVKEVLVFLKKYTKPVSIALVTICVLVLVNGFFKSQRLGKEATADAALSNARSIDDLKVIVNDYASTPAAPIALMGIALQAFNTGQVDEAEARKAQKP